MHILGYPVKVTALVDGEELDVTSSLVPQVTGNDPVIALNVSKFCDIVDAYQTKDARGLRELRDILRKERKRIEASSLDGGLITGCRCGAPAGLSCSKEACFQR
jgi:hypothetical protein